MSGQVREKRRPGLSGSSPEARAAEVPAPSARERQEKLKAELDDILDDIEGVLEENAEEFVAGYRQKGGQ